MNLPEILYPGDGTIDVDSNLGREEGLTLGAVEKVGVAHRDREVLLSCTRVENGSWGLCLDSAG